MSFITLAMWGCDPGPAPEDSRPPEMSPSCGLGVTECDLGTSDSTTPDMDEPALCPTEPSVKCAGDNSAVVLVDACTGAETIAEDCGAEGMCATKHPSAPTKRIDPQCIPAGCTVPVQRALKCDPSTSTRVLEVDLCTGEESTKRNCVGGQVCTDVDFETSEPIEAVCATPPAMCEPDFDRACSDDDSSVVDVNSCTGEETVVLSCGDQERCSTRDLQVPARSVDPRCVPETCTEPHQKQLRCDPSRPNIVLGLDLCNGETTVEQNCTGGRTCLVEDPDTGAAIEPQCGIAPVVCEPTFERGCSADGLDVILTNSCDGSQEVLLDCGPGQMCSTKAIHRPALTVPAQCVPDTCTVPHHQKELECAAYRSDLILERDLCTGDTSFEKVCVGRQICSTQDPLTGADVTATCIPEPETCTPRIERICDPNDASKIVDVEVCSTQTTPVFDCGADICSTFDPNNPARRITAQCVAPECTIPHATEQRCDDFNPRNAVSVDLCNGQKTTYLRCSLSETCSTEDPNDPTATVAPYCVIEPPTCNGNRVTRECDSSDPSVILEVNSCTGATSTVQDCGSDICSVRDTNNPARAVSARCVAPECTSPHATERRCDDFNPRRAVTVDLCNGRKTTDFTCGLSELCTTEDPTDPSASVAPYCVPKPVACITQPERMCDPANPSKILEVDVCAGTSTQVEDCGANICSTEDLNVSGRSVTARCVAPECTSPHATEQRCDDFNPRRIVTVDLCNGRKTTDVTCSLSETCSTQDPMNPSATIAPYCAPKPVVCGPDDIEYVCDPTDASVVLELDTCAGTSSVAQTCTASEICSTTAPNSPSVTIDAQCVPAVCGSPHDVLRRCDDFNPRYGVTVDLCIGGETVDFVCPLGDICSTRDPSDPNASVDPYCAPDSNACVNGSEYVCDPNDPSQIIERQRCTSDVIATTSCPDAQICSSLSLTSPPQPVPAECVPAACAIPHELLTQCDPANTRRIVTIDVCTGDEVGDTTCAADEICTVVDANDPTSVAAPRCAPTQCTTPSNDVTCDPNNPRQLLSTNSCTGQTTVIQTCSGALEQCSNVDENGSPIAPACVQQCGDAQTTTACDPSDPGKVFWANACGETTDAFQTCASGSTCEADGSGGARCSCASLGTKRCIQGLGAPSLFQDSRIVEDTTCGPVTVEQCGFGARCFQHPDYNNGEPECARTIDSRQASSPYYDYGCGNFSAFVIHKTNLEVDCRCRIYGFGEQGAGYVDPVTGARPGNSLQHCKKAPDVNELDWPIPAGNGPRMLAFTSSNSANDTWFGGHLDPATRTLYALVRWTNSTHRASGTIVSFDLDSGDREIISGIYPDPNMGELMFGSGYDSPNSVATGPLTQPLTGASVMRADAAGNLYTLGVGTTGDGNSRSAEIVKIDPTSGLRTLVWQSATDERGASTAGYGQCLPNPSATESLPITPNTLAIGPAGQFYLGFYHAREGAGLLEVSANGSTCTVLTWFNNQRILANNFGTGYTPQSGNKFEGLMYRNGSLYTTTSLTSALVRVNATTGNRVAISTKSDGYDALGYANIFWDSSRNLIWAVGKVPNLIGTVIDETTGRREEVFADTTVPGTPLMQSVYGVRRSIYSPTTTIANNNYTGRGAFFLDPNDPDIGWFILKYGALLKFEFSTFNNYIFSL